jgi:hypothetical protein
MHRMEFGAIRRGTMLALLLALPAFGALAQVTSEPLEPPPGDYGERYDPPPDDDAYRPPPGPVRPYRDPDSQPYRADEGDPYADPSRGGAYDPYADPTRGGAYDPDAARPPAYGAPSQDPYASPPGEGPAGGTGAGPIGPPGGEQTGALGCNALLAELQRYYGPAENPMQPRDQACAASRGDATAFRDCSDRFYREFEDKRAEYRRCLDQEVARGSDRIEQRESSVEAARSGYGGMAPQAAGPFARPGAPGWLGVQIRPVTPQAAYRLGVEGTEGAYVANAVQGSPAWKAGLRRGDIIVGFDGEPIVAPQNLQYHAERLVAGQTVDLEVIRGGRRERLTVEIEARR